MSHISRPEEAIHNWAQNQITDGQGIWRPDLFHQPNFSERNVACQIPYNVFNSNDRVLQQSNLLHSTCLSSESIQFTSMQTRQPVRLLNEAMH